MPFWLAPLLEFLGKLITGEIYQAWKQGKLKGETLPDNNVGASSNPSDDMPPFRK